MREKLPVILLSVVLIVGINHAFAQNFETLISNRFEPYLLDVMKEQDIPGFAIAVVKDGKIIYSKAFGVKNITSKEKMTTESLFHQASVTKTFVATSIMQLVEQGRIKLEDPVVKYVPYFKLADERYKNITIRQMVTHTSGMPDVQDYEWDKPGAYDDGALERYVKSLKDEKLINEPGTKFHYSNMAFEVLGDLIAKVSGITFADYVQKSILTPLKMTHSTLLKKQVDPNLLTTPHVKRGVNTVISEIYPYNRMHGPSSCLISNVNDMSRWAMANLNHGELDGVRILKESAYDTMWNKGNEVSGNVGICWKLGEHNGLKTIYHGGADIGYMSFVMMVPEKSLGIVAASNCFPGPITDIVDAVLSVALGENFTNPFAGDTTVDPDIYNAYVGEYDYGRGAILTVTKEEERLFAQMIGQPKFEIFPKSETEFFWKIVNAQIEFVKDSEGKVVKAIHHQAGKKIEVPKIK